MKALTSIFALLIFSSFSMGHIKTQQPIPDSLMMKAVYKTNMQVDSIFNSPEPITFKHLNDGFSGIIHHMDSLNANAIRLVNQRDSASKARDKAILYAIEMRNQNIKLEKENKEYEYTIEYVKMAPHILMIFVITLASSLVASGIISGFRKWKNNEM